MYGISPGIDDGNETMMYYTSNGNAMNMGHMLPQDGDDMQSRIHGNYYPSGAQSFEPNSYEGVYDDDDDQEEESYSQDFSSYEGREASKEGYSESVDNVSSFNYSQSPMSIMPPIGDWYKSATLDDKEKELRRTISNRDNTMIFPLHTVFRIKDLGSCEWKLSDVFKRAGEHSPYMYKGTPFHDDRTIKNIFLKDVSQNSPVSVDITASLVHPSSNEETMNPITCVLSSGNEEGPSHLCLRPKEFSDKTILLWRKDVSNNIPNVVIQNPGINRQELASSLGRHPNPKEPKLRTLTRDNLLISYVKEMIDSGSMTPENNPIEWRKFEGYGIIDAHRANALINKFIKDQSKVLSLRNIWDLRIKLSRGIQPNSSSSPMEDTELISEVPIFSHDKSSEVMSYIDRIKNIPYNLHWAIQVELEPESRT